MDKAIHGTPARQGASPALLTKGTFYPGANGHAPGVVCFPVRFTPPPGRGTGPGHLKQRNQGNFAFPGRQFLQFTPRRQERGALIYG